MISIDMDDIEKVQHLIEKGQALLVPPTSTTKYLDQTGFYSWRTQCIGFIYASGLNQDQKRIYSHEYQRHASFYTPQAAKNGIEILKSIKEDLETKSVSEEQFDPINIISNLCERFHLVARQLRSRYNGRDTLNVQDEYDVQDLFHTILHIHFDDIRSEEWTPSFAGASSRMDFLLKQEQIVIEIKKTRQGLGAREVGSQLIEDIERYKEHPDCKILICFVYDPEGKIANPRGIECDLVRVEGPIQVQVFIRP
jgi:hypothetical protein